MKNGFLEKDEFMEELVRNTKEIVTETKGEISGDNLSLRLKLRGFQPDQVIYPGSATIVDKVIDELIRRRVIEITGFVNDKIPILSLLPKEMHARFKQRRLSAFT